LPIPTDPPAATLLRPPDRWRKQASPPKPLGGPRLTLDRPVATSRTSPWPAGHARSPSGRPLAPGCGRRTLAWTSSPPISSSATPGSGWPGDGHGGPLDRPVGRTPPVQCDRPADGYRPRPDGGGEAADTSSAQRPTMRLASWPRPTTRPARPGPDRTGRQCACSLRPTQPLPASGPVPS
jgi:hypothetical protein